VSMTIFLWVECFNIKKYQTVPHGLTTYEGLFLNNTELTHSQMGSVCAMNNRHQLLNGVLGLVLSWNY
jgi:hypothetical protein